MRWFFSVIFALGGLFFLAALAAPGDLAGTKLTAIVIGTMLLFISWRLWRRSTNSVAEVGAPEPKSKISSAVPTQMDAAKERRSLIKAKLAYEDLKHLQGTPGMAAKQRATLILAKEGIRFVDPKDWERRYYTISWLAFRGVATSDVDSQRSDGQLNSVRAGAVARGTSLGGTVALETVGLLLDKSPLIISFQLVPNDPITSATVFSTWLNDEIARRILNYRTELVARGDLKFEANAEPGFPSSGAAL